jgi:hypothetical protein
VLPPQPRRPSSAGGSLISLYQAQRDLQTAPACWHNYWSGSRDRVDSSSVLL